MAGLYLHIPFCRRKCAYCDFYSFVGSKHDLSTYPSLLKKHLALASQQVSSQEVETVYFGGGTPSLLGPGAVGSLLEHIHRRFAVADNAEITLEVNPGTVCYEDLLGFRSAGVNRLSLGLQTTSDRQLAVLERLHTHEDGVNCVNWSRQAGFNNVSLDLMFALPGQTLKELEKEIEKYLTLGPEHLSCYGLTAEPHTPLHERLSKGDISLPEEGRYAEAFLMIHEFLSRAGYDHYEIANYARDGRSCRHNIAYWQRKAYLGIGAGAHSFVAEGWGSRWENPSDLTLYRKAVLSKICPEVLLETFDRESALKETVYLALRTRHGVLDEELLASFGCRLEDAFPEAVSLCAKWLQKDSGRWSFTVEGWLIFDHLIQHFL